MEHPYFGMPLVIQRGVPNFGMLLFWNACFGTPHLENPLEISFGTFQVLHFLECPYFLIRDPFWNAPILEFPFGNPTGRSKIWNAPIFGMSLFSTLKSDWILAGICWNQFLECPFFENICLDTCLDILERPFSDFGMSLDHCCLPS